MKWISVKEQLPENEVIIFVDGYLITIAHLLNDKWITRYSNDYGEITIPIDQVTHWMPLPSIPGKEQNYCQSPCLLCKAQKEHK